MEHHADINSICNGKQYNSLGTLETGLSKGGVLSPGDTGRGADVRREKVSNLTHAVARKRQKRSSHQTVEVLCF